MRRDAQRPLRHIVESRLVNGFDWFRLECGHWIAGRGQVYATDPEPVRRRCASCLASRPSLSTDGEVSCRA
jgi:hypothetical protein